MKEFEYIDEMGNDITYEASNEEVEQVAKKIGYENIVDTLTMCYKVDKSKLDKYTICKVIDCLLREGWIEPTDIADEQQIKDALYKSAIVGEQAYNMQQESDRDAWLERCRV